MNSELKQQFTMRISQANKTELCVILYEMFMTYTDDAIQNQKDGDIKDFRINIQRARGCLKELMGSLNFDYEPAPTLLKLYVYVSKLLVTADLHNQIEPLQESDHIMGQLRDAFAELAKTVTTGPVMENAQTVYAGLTYGKNDLNVNLNESSNRGFLV